MSNDVSLGWIVDMDIHLVMWCNKTSIKFNVWSLLHALDFQTYIIVFVNVRLFFLDNLDFFFCKDIKWCSKSSKNAILVSFTRYVQMENGSIL